MPLFDFFKRSKQEPQKLEKTPVAPAEKTVPTQPKATGIAAPVASQPTAKPVGTARITPRAATTISQKPAAAPPPPRPSREPEPEQAGGDLDKIVSALQQIEQFIADEDTGPQKATRDRSMSPVLLRIADVAKFAPQLFPANAQIPSDAVAEIYIKDLFTQLGRGKVTTSLKQLVADIPSQYLREGAADLEDRPIPVPLPLVVSALDPLELKKRTSSVTKNIVLDNIPTLFTPASPPKEAKQPSPTPIPTAPAQPPPAPKPPAVPAPAAAAAQTSTPGKPIVLAAAPVAKAQPSATPVAQTPPPPSATKPTAPPLAPQPPAAPARPVAQPPPAPVAVPVAKAEVPKAAPPAAPAAPQPPPQPEKPVAPTVSVPTQKPIPPAPAVATTKPVTPKPPLQLRQEAPPVAAKAAAPQAPVAAPPAAPSKPAEKPSAMPPVAGAPQIKPVAPPAPPPPAPAAPPPQPIAPSAPTPMAPGKIIDILLDFAKAPSPTAAPSVTQPQPAASVAAKSAATPSIPAPAAKPQTPAPPAEKYAPAPAEKLSKEAAASIGAALPPSKKPVEAKPTVVPPVPLPSIAGSGRIPSLMHRGIDLNAASSAEIASHLEGIGHGMAERIVADREQNGPFYALYDLARVSGIGAKLFEKITGWRWQEDVYGQLAVVNQVLDKWDGGLPDLTVVAKRFQALSGFDACVMLHADGHLLATSWDESPSQALEAMAPQILKRVAQYMKNVSSENMLSVTVFLQDRVVILAQHEDIIFAGIRSPRALNRRHLQVVHGMAMALGKRFSGSRDAAGEVSPASDSGSL